MLIAFVVPSCAESSRFALFEHTERNVAEFEACNKPKVLMRILIFV
jgi:hypothetical protein